MSELSRYLFLLGFTSNVLGMILFFISSALFLVFYFKTRLSRALLFLFFSELSIFAYVLAFLITTYVLDAAAPPTVVQLIYEAGNVSSILALLFAWTALISLQAPRQISTRFLRYGSLILLAGFSGGYNLSTMIIRWNGLQWSRQYDLLGGLLITLVVSLLLIILYRLFYIGIMRKQLTPSREENHEKSNGKIGEMPLIVGYLVTMALTIGIVVVFDLIPMIVGLSQPTVVTSTATSLSLLAFGLNQFILAFSIIHHPKEVFLGRIKFHELGAYSLRDGLTIFHVNPVPELNVDVDRDLLTVVLKGMEGVIARIIGAKQSLDMIGFGDRTIIFVDLKSHYFYAIVSEPSDAVWDITTHLARKWKRAFHRFKNVPLIEIAGKPELEQFTSWIKAYASKYLA